MKRANVIILSISAAFFIIAVHQTITLGFKVSYWIYMLSISLYLLSRLVKTRDFNKSFKKKEKKPSTKKKKKDKQQMNRRAKRFMERMK